MSDVAIMVNSCDKYADLWVPFFGVFRKRWPDCPYPLYVGANERTCAVEGVTTLRAGPDASWAQSTRKMLDLIDRPRVIMLLDDFLLTRPVDTARVRELVKAAEENDLTCLRLRCDEPPGKRLPGHPGLGVIRRGEDYRISAQAAVWDTRRLKVFLRDGFSAWDFELLGSCLADRLPVKIWGVYETAIHYVQSVERGKWLLEGLDICRQAGVPVDPSARAAMSDEALAAKRRANRRAPKALVKSILPRPLRRLIRLGMPRPWTDKYLDQMTREWEAGGDPHP